MDQRLWLLVEWIDEQNVFSNYGVINSNSLISREPDLHSGRVVFVRDKRNNGIRKAQVLRVSDNKNYVKEFKSMLERQDSQVKNVLSLCMNTIKEMKTGTMFLNANPAQSVPCPAAQSTQHRPGSDEVTSGSETDHEVNPELNMTKSTVRYDVFQGKHLGTPIIGQAGRFLNDKTSHSNRQSFVSSTPLPVAPAPTNNTLMFDQGAQTEPTEDYPPLEKVRQLESKVQNLYRHFLNLVARVENESEALERASLKSLLEQNADDTLVREELETEHQNTVNPELDDARNRNARGLQIRRASAQTTNTGLPPGDNDMISIGNGNVTVPVRLMAEIDWTSYTIATRQLLQAVFPRKVLATHSLTGKQSPAFADKPPKQRLDPKLVDDIVCTVAERCGVSKKVVRTIITTKCTDEAKLYRNRQHFKLKREQQNQENIAPSPASSNE